MENNQVLAKVENREITQNDLQFFLQSLNPQTAAQFQSEEGQKQLLQELIHQELFYLEARKNDLDQDPTYLQSLEKLKDNLLKQFAVTQLLNSISVSEEEIASYYEKNKKQFVSPKSVNAKHILVSKEEDAKKIIKEMKEEQISFEEAAKKYSSCPSKERGGELGFFSKGQMVPEFEKAAFNLEKNTISEPVKTQFGYHIIKVIDEKEAGTKSLEEAKPQIQQIILGKKQQEVYLKKVEDLKKHYKVEIAE